MSSRSFDSASTTSSRWRPRKKASGRRSTARAARSVTTCRRSAASAPSRKCAPAVASMTAPSRPWRPSGESLFHLFSVPGHACQPVHSGRSQRDHPPRADSAVRRRPGRSHRRRHACCNSPIRRGAAATASAGAPPSSTDRGTGERRVGRFGWKAQHATLLAFGADAYRNEMGITNDLFPDGARRRHRRGAHAAVRSDSRSRGHRRPAHPPRGIDNFASFMRFLAPVPRGGSSTR